MKRSFPLAYALTFVGLSGAILAGACGTDLPPSQTVTDDLTAGAVSATLSFQSDWGNGYCANVVISNGGTTAITGWQVVINLNQSTESQLWNGTPAIAGTQLTAGPVAWNGSVAPGSTASFGFCGNATGSSYHPTLVSVSSTGGSSGSTGAGGAAGTGGHAGTGGAVAGTGGSIAGVGGHVGVGGSVAGTGGAVTGTGGHVTGTGGAVTGVGGKAGTGGAVAGTGGHVTGTGGASSACTPGTPSTGGKLFSSNTQGNVGNGYSYQLWSNGTGSGSMTVYDVDAKFSATWSNVGDFLARVGLGFNSTKTPAQIGTITADFAETKTGGGGGFSYIGIYGWSENPLHEYYIVEDWFGSRPVPGTKVGTITVDGGTYDVLTHTQTNQPSITGSNQTFVQFWSVRQTARTCGTISISQHFSQWAALGLQLGNLEEARILLEAGNNSGSINFTTATVVVN